MIIQLILSILNVYPIGYVNITIIAMKWANFNFIFPYQTTETSIMWVYINYIILKIKKAMQTKKRLLIAMHWYTIRTKKYPYNTKNQKVATFSTFRKNSLVENR